MAVKALLDTDACLPNPHSFSKCLEIRSSLFLFSYNLKLREREETSEADQIIDFCNWASRLNDFQLFHRKTTTS